MKSIKLNLKHKLENIKM